MEHAYPEPPHCLGGDAEKLADPVSDVPARDAPVLPPERLEQRAWAALCTPAEVLCGEQSCAATVDASAPRELPVSQLLETVAVAARLAVPPLKSERRLALQEASQMSDAWDAPESSPEAWQRTLAHD
jgi:hypothetical protein